MQVFYRKNKQQNDYKPVKNNIILKIVIISLMPLKISASYTIKN